MKLAAFMSNDIADPKSCPRCNAALENKSESYLVNVERRSGSESLMMSCDGGSFCPKCRTVVLNRGVFKDTVSAMAGGWFPKYTVLGIVDLDAVPRSKRDIPLGEKGNPIPLIEFDYASTEPRETERTKLKKPKAAKPKKAKRAGRRWWLRLVGSQKPKTVKVGRNDPCPCGSGKKYKKCCMKKRRI